MRHLPKVITKIDILLRRSLNCPFKKIDRKKYLRQNNLYKLNLWVFCNCLICWHLFFFCFFEGIGPHITFWLFLSLWTNIVKWFSQNLCEGMSLSYMVRINSKSWIFFLLYYWIFTFPIDLHTLILISLFTITLDIYSLSLKALPIF